LDDGDATVIFVFQVVVLEIQSHEFVFIRAQPLLVHVDSLACFIAVVGVDDINLGRNMCYHLADFSVVVGKFIPLHGVAQEETEEGALDKQRR
jgi:hypothetical protein